MSAGENLNPRQFSVPISEGARQEMLAAASAGQRHAEMQQHAQRTPTNLSDRGDLRHHLMTAHEWEDHDFYRNSNWRASEIGHVVPESDDDRPMRHPELRRVHDDEHAAHPHDWPGSISMGDSHFHEA